MSDLDCSSEFYSSLYSSKGRIVHAKEKSLPIISLEASQLALHEKRKENQLRIIVDDVDVEEENEEEKTLRVFICGRFCFLRRAGKAESAFT